MMGYNIDMYYEIIDDFDNGVLNEFWETKWIKDGSVELSTSYVLTGTHSLKFTINSSNKLDEQQNSIERCEIGESYDNGIPFDRNIWYGLSIYIPEDFSINENRLVIAQWKQFSQNNYSPFLSFRIENGKISQKIKANNQLTKIDIANINPLGKWTDLKVNYLFRSDGTGKVSSFINGEPLCNYDGLLGFNRDDSKTYFKMGLYRDYIQASQTIYIDRFRRSVNESTIDASGNIKL